MGCKMKRIIKLIKMSKENQSQLSKEVGISHVAIHKIMKGKTKDIRLSTAFKLADALGVDINEFREEKADDHQTILKR